MRLRLSPSLWILLTDICTSNLGLPARSDAWRPLETAIDECRRAERAALHEDGGDGLMDVTGSEALLHRGGMFSMKIAKPQGSMPPCPTYEFPQAKTVRLGVHIDDMPPCPVTKATTREWTEEQRRMALHETAKPKRRPDSVKKLSALVSGSECVWHVAF